MRRRNRRRGRRPPTDRPYHGPLLGVHIKLGRTFVGAGWYMLDVHGEINLIYAADADVHRHIIAITPRMAQHISYMYPDGIINGDEDDEDGA